MKRALSFWSGSTDLSALSASSLKVSESIPTKVQSKIRPIRSESDCKIRISKTHLRLSRYPTNDLPHN
jgi:hypothetical protein